MVYWSCIAVDDLVERQTSHVNGCSVQCDMENADEMILEMCFIEGK